MGRIPTLPKDAKQQRAVYRVSAWSWANQRLAVRERDGAPLERFGSTGSLLEGFDEPHQRPKGAALDPVDGGNLIDRTAISKSAGALCKAAYGWGDRAVEMCIESSRGGL